jgi:4-amino-4-deoxy-L-arabinose transferase-like glycosyltransferase
LRYFDRNTWFWIGISGLFFLPFLGGVPLFDWDEINFAELAREMVVTGDWLRLQINFASFTEKPPLFFWLQAAAMSLLGVGEYAARLPNALLGMIVLPFLYISGKFLVDRKLGFLWALSWLGSILPFLYFKSGIIDPYFNFFIFLGLFFLIQYLWKKREERGVYLARGPATYWILAAIFTGLGILTKGPVAYLLIALTLASYYVFVRPRSFFGLSLLLRYSLLTLLIFLIWFALEWALHGPDFLLEFTIRQWELLTSADAGHGGFPGYHFVVLLLGCFPASIFALRALRSVEGVKPHVREFQRWMITLLLVVLILFSLVGTKVVHYSSLAYYPLTFLSALTLWHITEFPRSYRRWMQGLVLFIGFLAVLISAALPWAGQNIDKLKPLFEKDPFAVANLSAAVEWQVWDYTPAAVLSLVLVVYFLFAPKNPRFGFRLLFFGTALWSMLCLVFFLGKIERYSQHAAVSFFAQYAGEDVYVTTYHYKSYVPWFYARVMPYQNSRAQSREWLLHGRTDRPVIISTKVQHVQELESDVPDARLIHAENGFYFYQRQAYYK